MLIVELVVDGIVNAAKGRVVWRVIIKRQPWYARRRQISRQVDAVLFHRMCHITYTGCKRRIAQVRYGRVQCW